MTLHDLTEGQRLTLRALGMQQRFGNYGELGQVAGVSRAMAGAHFKALRVKGLAERDGRRPGVWITVKGRAVLDEEST